MKYHVMLVQADLTGHIDQSSKNEVVVPNKELYTAHMNVILNLATSLYTSGVYR